MVDLGSMEDIAEMDNVVKTDDPDLRWHKILMNDHEHIPLGLLMAWISALFYQDVNLHIFLVLVFTLSRLIHTYCLAFSVKSFRTTSVATGHICVWLMCLNGLAGSYLRGLGDMEGSG